SAVALRCVVPVVAEDVLITVGLIMTALALALALSAARLAVVDGGGPVLAIGVALGASGAILEQVVVRTWDAVWRADALGWTLIIGLALAVVGTAWINRSARTERNTRGWWAYGLYMSVTLYALGNIAFVNSQSGLRMS